jgi:hypothetical protein
MLCTDVSKRLFPTEILIFFYSFPINSNRYDFEALHLMLYRTEVFVMLPRTEVFVILPRTEVFVMLHIYRTEAFVMLPST